MANKIPGPSTTVQTSRSTNIIRKNIQKKNKEKNDGNGKKYLKKINNREYTTQRRKNKI